jgi:hypothetical protein
MWKLISIPLLEGFWHLFALLGLETIHHQIIIVFVFSVRDLLGFLIVCMHEQQTAGVFH